ncbi:MAG TPA: tetratricopeptide repeat protein [Bryobacteraceae bacterium]
MRGISFFFVFVLSAAALAAQTTERDRGIAAFQAGRYAEALSDLKAAAAKNPHDQRAAVFLALDQAAQGNCKAALPELLRTRKDANLDLLAGLAAAKCYSAAGDEARTFARLAQLKKRFPKNADVLYLDAKLHMKAFNNATFAMFQRTPNSYRVHELSAEIFEVNNRYSEAIGEYRKAIALAPQAPGLHYRLGRALLLAKHTPESMKQAAAAFEAELKLSPEDAASEFQLGQIAQAQANPAKAEAHFARAVKLSPHFVQALIALGKSYTHDKRHQQAISVLERAVKIQPNNERAHYALMTAYRDSGQMQKAQAEEVVLQRLRKPPEGEFSEFLKKLGDQNPKQ